MTKDEVREYLEHLHDVEFPLYLPAVVFLIILAVVGLVGNVLVLLVYRSKYQRTPSRIFIMAIAGFDLVANVVCIPGDVYDLFHLWDFTQVPPCRLFRYFNATTTITSASILLAVSVARYRKICRPFGWQVKTRHAKMISLCIAIFGMVASIPYGILNGSHTRPTPLPGIVGYECSISDEYIKTVWPLLNHFFFLLLFLSLCVPLVVLYCLIGVAAYHHHRLHGGSTVSNKTTTTTSYSYTQTSLTDENEHKHRNRISSFFKRNHKNYQVTKTESSAHGSKSEEKTEEVKMSGSEITGAMLEPQEDKQKGATQSWNSNRDDDREDQKNEKEEEQEKEEEEDGKEKAEKEEKKEEREGEEEEEDETRNHIIDLSMVHELTVKLNRIKSKEGSSGDRKSGECQSSLVYDMEDKEDYASSHGIYNDSKREDRKDDNSSKTSPKFPIEAETDCSENVNAEDVLSCRLQWIDKTFCPPETEEESPKTTPETAKKSSLSNKVSREGSQLKKQKSFRESVMNTLTRRRAAKVENSSNKTMDDDVEGGEGQNVNKTKPIEDPQSSVTASDAQKDANAETTQHQDKTKVVVVVKPTTETKSSHPGIINRTTLMLILITVVYILSYFPHLALMFYRFTQPESYKSLGSAGLMAHHFFLRMYFLNSAANPIIYSLSDVNFRKDALRILFRFCQRNSWNT